MLFYLFVKWFKLIWGQICLIPILLSDMEPNDLGGDPCESLSYIKLPIDLGDWGRSFSKLILRNILSN